MKRFALISFLVLGSLAISSCKEDPDDTPQKLAIYLAVCPNGTSSCYTDCGAKTDGNGNGAVDASEEYDFGVCKGQCDIYCNVSFLYSLSD